MALSLGVSCSDCRGGATPMVKCAGCGGTVHSADGKCASCDRCAGCGREAKAAALCPKDKKCAQCDSCGK